MQRGSPDRAGEFRADLEDIVTRELRTWQPALAAETMRAFDLGCFPWHGYLELSFLTADEPQLVADADAYKQIGEWKLYNFASKRDSSLRRQREELGARMAKSWSNSDDKRAATEGFLQAAVLVLKSEAVRHELEKFQRVKDFVVTVFDPDNHRRGNLVKPG